MQPAQLSAAIPVERNSATTLWLRARTHKFACPFPAEAVTNGRREMPRGLHGRITLRQVVASSTSETFVARATRPKALSYL